MSEIYEDYYKEIRDKEGRITEIEFDYDDSFNFAYDVMDRYAEIAPGERALVHKTAEGYSRNFSYGDIKRLSDKAASMLRGLGVGRKDVVMLLLKRRLEFWISILAIHKLGAVAVPTSHMVSAEDIADRARLSGAKVIICVNDDDICEKVENAIGKEDITQLVVGVPYKDKPLYSKLLDEASEDFERVTTSVHDHMLYYFTSGTNGAPKAVIHDYSYPLAHIYTAKNWHGVIKGGLHLTVADSGWAKSAWGKLYGQWFMGSAIMVYDYKQFYAGDMLKLLEEEKINTFCAPPTIYKYLVREDLGKYKLNNLRYVTTAGEPMPAEVSEKFLKETGFVVREGFGQTETALLICTSTEDKQKKESIGYASPLYDIRLVDDMGNAVQTGKEGEIVIVPKHNERPIGVFSGYLGDEALYKEVWEGGVYHTKDKAIMDENGAFYFVGRNDDVIKSSGYRIGPSEVEDILMRHPAVFECAVTAYPSKTRGALVKASVVLNSEYKAEDRLATELQDFVKSRAAFYKFPRIVAFVDGLPRTTNGKICRAKIREQDYLCFSQKK